MSEQEEAALLVNFYIYNDEGQTERLVKWICDSQNLRSGKRPNTWIHDSSPAIMLKQFHPAPSSAADTFVIQVALEDEGRAEDVWPKLRERVRNVVQDGEEWSEGVLGYSLFYYAKVDDVVDEAKKRKDTLTNEICRIEAAEGQEIACIVEDQLADGELSLWTTPIWEGGKAAAMIYIGFGSYPPFKNNLMRDFIFGRSARLLMPDLIAHKYYHQVRKIDKEGEKEAKPGKTWRKTYNDNVEVLRKAVQTMLRHHPGGHQAQAVFDEHDLNPVIRHYEELFAQLVRLDAYLVSLSQQCENHRFWKNDVGGKIVAYQQGQMDIAVKDLELLTSKAKYVLNTAQITVDIARNQVEKQREAQERLRVEHDRRITQLLAVVGVVVVVPELLPAETICAFFGWQCEVWEGYAALDPVLVQIGIIILFSTIGWRIVGEIQK
jgi:hypothetical protein